ncbi:cytochrome P450 [Lenzites betulinus]|nr:cytochrome P450 [Lenzites betulinus]
MADSLVVAATLVAILPILWLFLVGKRRLPQDNIPGPPSPSFVVGNFVEVSDRRSWLRWRELIATYGHVCRLRGMLGARLLHVSDPRAMYSIFVKDVENYRHNNSSMWHLRLLLGPGLLTVDGDQHKKQRKLLNPVFSVNHLRDITHILYGIANRLENAIESRAVRDGGIVDVNGWMGRTTLEMLGQAALGTSFDGLVGDSADAYGDCIKNFFPTFGVAYPFLMLIPLLSRFLSERLIKKVFEWTPNAALQRMMWTANTLERRSREIIDEKKAALQKGDDALGHQIGEGKDILSLLLKANMVAADAEKHTDEELVAQMTTFILGGMDTSSNVLSRILNFLAERQDVQDKLRAELLEACGNEDVGYDELSKLPYLEAVVRETLRLFTPVQSVTRHVRKDTTLPLSKPIRGIDGSVMTEVPLVKGTFILVHLAGSNTNKELWGEDAYEWKPERWLDKLPQALEDAHIPSVYANLMTFVGGTRACIGFKFAQLEMKIILLALLRKLKFELTDRPIVWNSAPVQYPTMGEDSNSPEMLLKVTRIS